MTAANTITVGSAPVQLAAADGGIGEELVGASVTNPGPVTVYLGGSDVTASTGTPLVSGATLSIDLEPGDRLYGITASGTQDVNVIRVLSEAAEDWATVTVEYAPDAHPYYPIASRTWTALGSARTLSIQRGRQDELGTMEAGTATVVLDDPDGAIFRLGFPDANSPLLPLTPVRVIVTHDGTDYVRFTGFAIDAPQPSGSKRAPTATLQCMDWLGWAASVDMPGSKWATYVSSEQPIYWLSTDATGSNPLRADYDEHVRNLATRFTGINAGNLYAVADPLSGYPMYADPLVDNPTPGGSGQMWANGWAGTRTAIGFANFNGTAYEFTLAVWIQKGSPPLATTTLFAFTSEPFGGTNKLRVAMTTSGRIQVTLGSSSVTSTSGVNHADDNPHLILIRSSGTNLQVGSDLTAYTTTAISTNTTIFDGYLWFNSSQNISFNWTDLVIFGDVVTIGSGAWVADTQEIGGSQDAEARATYLARVAGLTVDGGAYDDLVIEDHTDPLLWSSDFASFGGSLADGITTAAESRFGTAWVTVDGTLRLRDFSSLTDGTYAEQYADRLALLTDADRQNDLAIVGQAIAGQAVAAAPDLPVVRYSSDGTTAGRLSRIINTARITLPDGDAVSVVDWDSVARYGDRVYDVDAELQAVGNLRLALADVVERYASAPVEVGAVTVEPWKNANATALVLSAELERAVHYHETGADGETLVDGRFRIQSERWDWADGTHWTVTYTIAAA